MKFLIKLAAVVLVLGGLLTGVGAALGGHLYTVWYGGRPHRWDEAPVCVPDDPCTVLPEAGTVVPVPDDASLVHSLEFSLGRGSFLIQRGASYSITSADGDRLDSTIDEGVWQITCTRPRSAQPVTITLPEHAVFDEVELELGAGTVQLCDLTAAEIDLTVGAGSLQTGTLDAPSISLSVGAGQAEAALAGAWDNYRYEAQAGMGSITIDDQALTNGIAYSGSGGSGPRTLELEAGMGSIALHTQP